MKREDLVPGGKIPGVSFRDKGEGPIAEVGIRHYRFAKLVPVQSWKPVKGIPYEVFLVRKIGERRGESEGVFLVSAVDASRDESEVEAEMAEVALKAAEAEAAKGRRVELQPRIEVATKIVEETFGQDASVLRFFENFLGILEEDAKKESLSAYQAERLKGVLSWIESREEGFGDRVSSALQKAREAAVEAIKGEESSLRRVLERKQALRREIAALYSEDSYIVEVDFGGKSVKVNRDLQKWGWVHERTQLNVPASADEYIPAMRIDVNGFMAWVQIKEPELLEAVVALFGDELPKKRKEVASLEEESKRLERIITEKQKVAWLAIMNMAEPEIATRSKEVEYWRFL